ncbi:MAG: right-handed parallel beta-helix repeat-containing protein [Bdellovibrio sp.]
MQLIFILAIFIQVTLGFQKVNAATFYVSASGNDANNGTSLSTPFKTISKGVSSAQASGDIVYVMTGIYNEAVSIRQSGITLSAYPNNYPVIDGRTTFPNYDWGALILIDGNYNKISGFEVKNSNINGYHSGGHGIWMGGHHNTVSKVNVHHTWAVPVLAEGDYSIVEDSQIWQGTRSNANNTGQTTSGWGTGLSAARNRTSAAIKPGINSYSILRRNRVFNNWGEGLSCYEADHCTLEDNIVYDNWTNNLYLSDTTNSVVQRNIVYISSNPAINFRSSAHTGITLADELSNKPRSANNYIINNFLYNVDLGAFYWTLVPGSGLNNVLIANNTIVDGNLYTGSGGSWNIVNSNSQIRNNIILGKNSSVPSANGITFSNNNWAVTPSAAYSPTNVGGDPQIARTGATTAGNLTSSYFKVLGTSPVINAAMPLTNVSTDFFGTSRSNSPDIGGYEFISTAAVPTPTPSLSVTSYYVQNITAYSATIYWTTNSTSSSMIYYGTSPYNLNLTAGSAQYTGTSRYWTIWNLKANTVYYYKIVVTNGSTTAASPVASFRTPY